MPATVLSAATLGIDAYPVHSKSIPTVSSLLSPSWVCQKAPTDLLEQALGVLEACLYE
jgi:hypothetical protein